MTSRYRWGALALAVMCLVGFTALLIAPAAPAGASASRSSTPVHPASRPSQAVAYAEPAVVRVLSYYYGTTGGGVLTAAPVACAGVGALVGTTGANSFNYVLTATSLLNPALPCEGAQAAFQQIYGPGQGWALNRIEVWLGTAYTGSAANQIGTIRFKSDPAQITTNVSLFAQKLVALPLTPLSGAPSHDLPVLQVPQPSDLPVGPSQSVLDLGNGGAEPIGRDSLNSNEAPSTLLPVSLSADALNHEVLPTPTQPPTATPPQQTVVGGTVVPTQPPAGGPTPQATPTALSSKVSVGAPVVNENGALVGMVIADDAGAHVIAPLSQVTEGISSVSGKPGPIMTQWKTGLTAFYAAPPTFAAATTAWTSLLGTAPDFAGIAPYLAAAKARSTDVTPPASSGSPTVSPTANTSPGPASTSISLPLLVTLVGFVLFVVLLAVALLVMRLVRGIARGRRKPEPVAQEAGGQLPPASVPLGLPEAGPQPDFSSAMDALPTLPQRAVSAESAETPPPDAIFEQATETLATVTLPTAPVAPRSRGARLVPQAAGLTNPGRRRAADPNQDNILAATGTYTGGGSPQPFGLFIVADGMGGHADGKEASRRTIEVMAGHVIPALTRGQPLDASALSALLREAATQANADLGEQNLNKRADMGTTVTAALVVGDVAYVANVGDSRTYLFSPDRGLHAITTDHSIVASLVAAGVIRPEDVYTHPRRNQIYRSLGGQHAEAEVDLYTVVLEPGDRLLLCSDGLWEMVRDPQIEAILRTAADPAQACELLVQEANANGGEDNVSVVVVRLLDEQYAATLSEGIQVIAAPEDTALPDQA